MIQVTRLQAISAFYLGNVGVRNNMNQFVWVLRHTSEKLFSGQVLQTRCLYSYAGLLFVVSWSLSRKEIPC